MRRLVIKPHHEVSQFLSLNGPSGNEEGSEISNIEFRILNVEVEPLADVGIRDPNLFERIET